MSPLMNTFLPPPRSDLFDVRLRRGHKPTWAARHSTYLQCGTHILHFASQKKMLRVLPHCVEFRSTRLCSNNLTPCSKQTKVHSSPL